MSNSTSADSGGGRMVTWRSILFGLFGVFMMSGLAGYHDQVLGGTPMIGNHIPAGAFSYFIFIGLCWNGLWGLLDRMFGAGNALRRVMALSSRELILVMIVTMVACFPPTSGLFRYFHRMIMLPWYYLGNNQQWQVYELLTGGILRPEIFPTGNEVIGSKEYNAVYSSFATGLATGGKTVALHNLPLAAWIRPMLVWTPLIVLMSIAMVSLQFLLHRQWAVHEQLSYPVAQVAGSFCDMRKSGGRGVPDIFANRLFWWGFIPVFLLLFFNYLAIIYPNSLPQIADAMPSFKEWALPVRAKIPILYNVPETGILDSQVLYFTIIGIAFFISSEVSLTMGLAPILLGIFGSFYVLSTGTAVQASSLETSRAGAYVGFTIMLFYTGRHYYLHVLARAIGIRFKARDGDKNAEFEDGVSVLAARTMLISFVGFTIVFSWMCQSWVIAIFYSLLLFILYMVISRIVCESGIPFVQCNWTPGELLVKLLGPAAMGPKALTFSLWSTGILAQDPRESLMPYVATGIKMSDEAGIKLKRVFWIIIAAVLLALTVAFFSSTFSLYNFSSTADGWAANYTPQHYLKLAARNFSAMEAIDVLEKSRMMGPVERLGLINGSPLDTRYFFYGAAAVLVFTLLRFRFSGFPLHPVLFLMVGTYPSGRIWWSFLMGWFIKTLVVKFGGGSVYNKMKPLFVGLIAGELVMIGLTVLIDFMYYWIMGAPTPVKYFLMPG